MARRSRRLNPPSPLDALSDDVLIVLLARAPWALHGTLRTVCRRFRALLTTPAFRQQRVESGYAEHAVVVAGGRRDGAIAECSLLAGGRWRPIAPLSGPRAGACSAVFEGPFAFISHAP